MQISTYFLLTCLNILAFLRYSIAVCLFFGSFDFKYLLYFKRRLFKVNIGIENAGVQTGNQFFVFEMIVLILIQ